MIIRKYGIVLRRLTESDLELVRTKRNSPEIRERMFYQEEISPESQRQWFETINNENNYYFIIEYDGNKVGLIHGKIHSYQDRVAEGGMFIWDDHTIGSHIPIIASVCMADLTFLVMKMDKTVAEVRTDNSRALKYNLDLGYKITEKEKGSDKVFMELSRKDYFISAEKIRETVRRIARDPSELSWDDIEIDNTHFKELYENLPDYLKKEVQEKLANA